MSIFDRFRFRPTKNETLEDDSSLTISEALDRLGYGPDTKIGNETIEPPEGVNFREPARRSIRLVDVDFLRNARRSFEVGISTAGKIVRAYLDWLNTVGLRSDIKDRTMIRLREDGVELAQRYFMTIAEGSLPGSIREESGYVNSDFDFLFTVFAMEVEKACSCCEVNGDFESRRRIVGRGIQVCEAIEEKFGDLLTDDEGCAMKLKDWVDEWKETFERILKEKN